MAAKPVHTLSEYNGGWLGTVVAFINVQVLAVLSLLLALTCPFSNVVNFQNFFFVKDRQQLFHPIVPSHPTTIEEQVKMETGVQHQYSHHKRYRATGSVDAQETLCFTLGKLPVFGHAR